MCIITIFSALGLAAMYNLLIQAPREAFPSSGAMEGFFNILSHAVIIIGFLVKFILSLVAIFSPKRGVEKMLRATSMTCGLLIFFAARKMNLTITDLMIQATTITNPITFGLGAIIFPGFLGVVLAWYVIRTLKKSHNIAVRVMIMVGIFTLFLFADLYVISLQKGGFHFDKLFLPNVCFTIGISLYAILRYDPFAGQDASEEKKP